MVKPEWGTKRNCPKCGERFYDLGTDDPVTPQRYANQIMKGLHKGKHIVAAGQGHGQLATGCIARLMAEFVAAGTVVGLDDSCVRSIGPAPFLLSRSSTAP